MSRWMEQLRPWQFALFWGIVTFAGALLAGMLFDWLLKGHINFSFLIPYGLVFALTTGIPATIRQRSLRLDRESQ